MDKETFDNIFEMYMDELSNNMKFDDHFHVDVEHDKENIRYSLLSTLYGECSCESSYEHPPETTSLNLVVQHSSLFSVDVDGKYKYYDKECDKIIRSAIKYLEV
jgi:hypothetical protein